MSDTELNADEGVAAVLGLVLVKTGDVRLTEVEVGEGLPPDSRVVLYWDEDEMVIGIRELDWKHPDAD